MTELVPFRALRYTPAAADLSLLLAPPYDVIDTETEASLRDRDPHNCVRLILPAGSPEQRYEAAATLLRAWLDDGSLATDREAAAYVYRQEFQTGGIPAERLAIFAALRLSPFEAGEVLPHEHTHAGPKKDRLALTLATRTQLSPIFLVAPDRDGTFYRLARGFSATGPVARATAPDGIRHTLWRVTGDAAHALLSSAGALPLLIADGHHRYETALAAKEILGGSVKAAYVLACVVSQADPGLVVKPTHRLLTRPPSHSGEARVPDRGFEWIEALADSFDLKDLGSLDPSTAEVRAAEEAPGSFVVLPGDGGAWLANGRPEAVREAAVPGERARIAPVMFDRFVLQDLYRLMADEAAEKGILQYSSVPLRGPAGGCSFVLPPVSLDDVWATVSRGGLLPPKSTYFEPKVPSGLLFRPL